MKSPFRSRGGGPFGILVDVVKFAYVAAMAIKERVAGVPEKRFEDIFPDGSRTARAMREEGMSTIVDEPESFGLRREDEP